MPENLPFFVNLIFCISAIFAIGCLFKATNFSKICIYITSIWITAQTLLGLSGFYSVMDSNPPRSLLLLLPPMLLVLIFFSNERSRTYIDSINVKYLTLLHVVRIPVEIVLFWLYLYKTIPALMTFEGRNFDIFSGITAPIIFYFGYINTKFSKPLILAWNYVCLALLLNIVFNSVLSIPTPIQQFAFDQPNIAILNFPFLLLPSVIVPIVFFSHLAAIRQCRRSM